MLRTLALSLLLFCCVGFGKAQTTTMVATKDCSSGCSGATTIALSPSTTAGHSIVLSMTSDQLPVNVIGTTAGVSCGVVPMTIVASALQTSDIGGGSQNSAAIFMSQTYYNLASIGYTTMAPSESSCTINATSTWHGQVVVYDVSGTNEVQGLSSCFNSGSFPNTCVETTGTATTTSVTSSYTTTIANQTLIGITAGFPNTPTITGALTTTDHSTSTAVFNHGVVASAGVNSYTASWASGTSAPTQVVLGLQPATVTAPPVIFNFPTGNYHSTSSLTMTSPVIGAPIYYNTTGSPVCGSSTLYTAPVSVSSTTTYFAVACPAGFTAGTAVSTTLTIIGGSPTTWYVRQNGGTPTQCTGKTDADYPGSGSGVACAFQEFRYLYSNNTNSPMAWVIAGGDSVLIRGCGHLSTQINPADPNCRVGYDNPNSGSVPNGWCGSGVPTFSCFAPPLPAGTSGQHTRILGQNYAACNTGGAVHPEGYVSNLTQIYGGFAVAYILNLANAQYVDVQCIELTTHNFTTATAYPTLTYSSGTTYNLGDITGDSGNNYVSLIASNIGHTPHTSPSDWQLANQCVRPGPPSYPTSCQNGTPYSDYGNTGVLTNNATSNLLLQDVYIHGMAASGIEGPIGGPITLTRVSMNFNPFASWDFDDGSDTPDFAGSSIVANHVNMNHNGCAEQYPDVNTIPILVCYDINTSGGFGDAWSGQDTELDSFTCNDCTQSYNTKDGFIGPHTWTKTLSITNSASYANMGQQWKWGANYFPSTVTFINNLTVGNCVRLQAALTGAPSNYNQFLGDWCRASGEIFGSVFTMGSNWTVSNNTTIGVGPEIYLFACAQNLSPCNGTATFQNNIGLGYQDPNSPYGTQTSVLYDLGAGVTKVSSNNVQFGIVGGDTCGGTITCATPLLTSQPAQTWPAGGEPALDVFTITGGGFFPTSSSPALLAGTTYTGQPSTDYFGTASTSPLVIGAVNEAGAPTITSITVLPNPGTVTTTGTLNMATNSFCTYSDSSTLPVGSGSCTPSWTDTGAHSSINSSTGIVSGAFVGSDTVTATSGSISGNATINVVLAGPTGTTLGADKTLGATASH